MELHLRGCRSLQEGDNLRRRYQILPVREVLGPPGTSSGPFLHGTWASLNDLGRTLQGARMHARLSASASASANEKSCGKQAGPQKTHGTPIARAFERQVSRCSTALTWARRNPRWGTTKIDAIKLKEPPALRVWLFQFPSGRRDSNSRPLVPQTSALTRLRYAPDTSSPLTLRLRHCRSVRSFLSSRVPLPTLGGSGGDARSDPLAKGSRNLAARKRISSAFSKMDTVDEE
jgi:hypothetical protein